jgi:prophage regulatory protein
MVTKERDLLTVREVAARLGISRWTVWRMATEGILPPPIRLGRRIIRWRIADIEQALRDATLCVPSKDDGGDKVTR